MIIKIICAGQDSFSKLYKRDEGEFLIGVDGGADTLIKNRLPIDLAIGDFDSSSITRIKNRSKATIIYQPHKDKSDLELAIKHISSQEFRVDYITNRVIEKIIIYNATGKRLDHYQAVLNVIIRYMHLPIRVIDGHNMIEIVNSKTTFKKSDYQYISFFAVDEQTVISLRGFKYDLKQHPLSVYDSLCLSNEIIAEEAILETNNKKILVFHSK